MTATTTTTDALFTGQSPDPYMRSCPRWCNTTHEFSWGGPVDRVHIGADHRVPLELEQPLVYRNRPGEMEYGLDYANAYVQQNYRAAEPVIHLCHGEALGMDMTIDEVRQLRDVLADVIADAEHDSKVRADAKAFLMAAASHLDAEDAR